MISRHVRFQWQWRTVARYALHLSLALASLGHPLSSDGACWRFIAASVSSPCPCTEHMPYASLASWCTQAEAPSLPLARPHAEAPSLPPTVRTFVVGRVTVSTVGDLRRAVLCEISYACPELGS